jgi:hypothetical protein
MVLAYDRDKRATRRPLAEVRLRFPRRLAGEDRAREATASLAARIDPSAIAPVGGAEWEALRPLDLSARPDRIPRPEQITDGVATS